MSIPRIIASLLIKYGLDAFLSLTRLKNLSYSYDRNILNFVSECESLSIATNHYRMKFAKYLSTKPVVNEIEPDCPLRLLVVEDNAINLRVLTKLLSRMGYQPDAVVNGQEAVDAVTEKEYDIVFMDLQMPVMGGIEASSKIKQIMGEDAPWITAFTANSDQTNRLACREAGMDDFISKPSTPKRIEEVIRKAHTIRSNNR